MLLTSRCMRLMLRCMLLTSLYATHATLCCLCDTVCCSRHTVCCSCHTVCCLRHTVCCSCHTVCCLRHTMLLTLLYAAHVTLYAAYVTLYAAHVTLYAAHVTLYAAHVTLYAAHCSHQRWTQSSSRSATSVCCTISLRLPFTRSPSLPIAVFNLPLPEGRKVFAWVKLGSLYIYKYAFCHSLLPHYYLFRFFFSFYHFLSF
jgi:hypothetical protein